MKATLEPIVFILRIHEDDDAKLGDPFIASCTVTLDDNHVANLKGQTSTHKFSKKSWAAVHDALLSINAKTAFYTRKRYIKHDDGTTSFNTKAFRIDLTKIKE